ncbi:MAG: NAD(P)-binding protein [Luteitalea sp.]|nr:NAD(P)-binding protein [Luteitalea sp.]
MTQARESIWRSRYFGDRDRARQEGDDGLRIATLCPSLIGQRLGSRPCWLIAGHRPFPEVPSLPAARHGLNDVCATVWTVRPSTFVAGAAATDTAGGFDGEPNQDDDVEICCQGTAFREPRNKFRVLKGSSPMKVLIGGGGIGGLVTALYLHEAGIDCTVFEQSDITGELGVGINLLPHAITKSCGGSPAVPGALLAAPRRPEGPGWRHAGVLRTSNVRP